MTITPALGADKATDELLPCPFCGGQVEFSKFEFSGVPMCEVRCCLAKTGRSSSPEKAAHRWNRRATLAAVPASKPEMWRVRYLCTAILNNCVVEETKRDARMVYDAIEGKSAAPAPVSGMPDLASLPVYWREQRGGTQFKGVVGMGKEQFYAVADVERLLNPTGETK